MALLADRQSVLRHLSDDAGARSRRDGSSARAGDGRRACATSGSPSTLIAAGLFAYEYEGLWNLPRATALIIVGYFAAALLVDLLFTGASFCKFVCPIGQFNFVAATVAPFELQVREPETCRHCRTVDCIKGRPPVPALQSDEAGFMPVRLKPDTTTCPLRQRRR